MRRRVRNREAARGHIVAFGERRARRSEPEGSTGPGEASTACIGDAAAAGRSKGVTLIYVRDLLWALVVRDIKIRYEGTFLGFAWMLAKPFLFVAVFFFVFEAVLSLETPRFTSFTLIGMLVYIWFQSSLVGAATVAFSNRELVRRPQFRMAVLPLISVMSNLVHFLLSLPFLVIVLLVGGSEPSAALLALPLVLIVQFLLTAGLAYLAAAASILFRDIGHLLEVILSVFFFVTPIFYEASRVPAAFQPIYQLNPLTWLLEGYRNPLLHALPPDWGPLAIVGATALGVAMIGYWLFERVSHQFAEEV